MRPLPSIPAWRCATTTCAVANYFDAAKFPTITFKSKSAQTAGEGKLKIVGDLTIHGVTKEVTLDVDGPSKPMTDPRGNTHVGASATTTIKRTDFGVGSSNPMIGEDISITIDVEWFARLHPAQVKYSRQRLWNAGRFGGPVFLLVTLAPCAGSSLMPTTSE